MSLKGFGLVKTLIQNQSHCPENFRNGFQTILKANLPCASLRIAIAFSVFIAMHRNDSIGFPDYN